MRMARGSASGSPEVQSAAPSQIDLELPSLTRIQQHETLIHTMEKWYAATDPLYKLMLKDVIDSMRRDLGMPPLPSIIQNPSQSNTRSIIIALGKNCNLRVIRTVACCTSGQSSGSGSAQDSNQSSIFSRTETYALLKQQLEVAAKSEDYKEAARIRDSLKLFEDEEPVLRLRRLLKEAIAEDRFEEGDYGMKHIDKLNARTFNVVIAPFSLSIFGDGVDNI
ncbi:uncharacterized protein LOC121752625 [Salvia splendens]|uniref:uncharacterized protein LOC121752625 n=1 Tax=Salvia splendens TaxID=180675 RepID=UPI001C27A4F1|nr:uncharacterized protein LOC121752625 [Salvia splendens]